MTALDSSKVRITVNDREIGTVTQCTVTQCVLTPPQPNEMLIKSSFSMQMERLDAFFGISAATYTQPSNESAA